MARMRIDVCKFVRDYHEAAEAKLSSRELAMLLGICQSSLWSRVEQCRQRGIALPVLRGGHQLDAASRKRRKDRLLARIVHSQRPDQQRRRTARRARMAATQPAVRTPATAQPAPAVDASGFVFSVTYF